ncbi:hypothetical protein GCM10009540_21880 [Streptomyces turgidiscabies]
MRVVAVPDVSVQSGSRPHPGRPRLDLGGDVRGGGSAEQVTDRAVEVDQYRVRVAQQGTQPVRVLGAGVTGGATHESPRSSEGTAGAHLALNRPVRSGESLLATC